MCASRRRTRTGGANSDGRRPRTDDLEEDPTWDSYGYWGDNFVGTIRYTYSETYDYHWLPDSAGDDPVATTFRINGSTILQFEPSSGVFDSGGTATATMTLGQGGNTASVTATATPPNLFHPGPNPANQDLWVDVPVSGEAGQFTLNFVGLMQMPGNGSIKGRFRAERIAPLQTAYVWMSTPGNGAVVPVYPTPFGVTGGHNTGEGRFRRFSDTSRVVKVYINHAYNPAFPLWNAHLKGEHRNLPNQGRWAVQGIYLTDPTPPIHIIAELRGFSLEREREEDIGMDVDQVTAAGAP